MLNTKGIKQNKKSKFLNKVFFKDTLFIFALELLIYFIYLKGPIPSYFPFPLIHVLHEYFNNNISQFFIIYFIPYIPIFLYSTFNANLHMFLGLTIFWVPSIFLALYLTRKLLAAFDYTKTYSYIWAYLPILFIVFTPHTLFELLSFNGAHSYFGLIEIFIMYSTIISVFLFVYTRKILYMVVFFILSLFINYQNFPFSMNILIIMITIFVALIYKKLNFILAGISLFAVSIGVDLIELYASFSTVSFPFSNLALPNIGLQTDPNYRVFLESSLNPSRNLINILSFQYFAAEGPFYPTFYNILVYKYISLFIGIIALISILYVKKKLNFTFIPIYLSFVVFDLLDIFANPYISLVWPQHIYYFTILSYLFNNNLVFFYPLIILASFSFLIGVISIYDIIQSIISHHRKRSRNSSILFYYYRKLLIKKRFFQILAIAIVFLLLTSPLITNSINEHNNNSKEEKLLNPYIKFFENKNNASVYFNFLSDNSTTHLITSDSIALSNYKLVGEQVYAFNNAMDLYMSINPSLRAEFINYLMNEFGYNYIVTSSSSFSELSNSSQFFRLSLNDEWIHIYKVIPETYNTENILFTTSATQLVSYIDFHKDIPDWIYSPYVENITSINTLYAKDNIYAPYYDNLYNFYIYTPGTTAFIPAQYTDNSYYSNEWGIGYLPGISQATWSQNIPNLNNYQYQGSINSNYGVIYTEHQNATLNANYNLEKGNYLAVARVLKSSISNYLDITINGQSKTINTYSYNSSYFEYLPLMNISSNGHISISIKNLGGLNAINIIMFIPNNVYNQYKNKFSGYINSTKNPVSLPDTQPLEKYKIEIKTNYTDKTLLYQQEINITGNYTNSINSDWSNIAFINANNQILDTWIQNYSTSSRFATVWLKLVGEYNQTVYLLVYNKSYNFMSSMGFLGEAPALSPIYGEYFNAPEVFGKNNAWDWAASSQGWNIIGNSTGITFHNGAHVYGQINGVYTIKSGICLPSRNLTGMQFNLYGWTDNNTVIQESLKNSTAYSYGWAGSSPYAVQDFPIWTNETNIYGATGNFYIFSIANHYNGTVIASISNSTFSSTYRSATYNAFSTESIVARESRNGPQYYEYAFVQALPLRGMPKVIMEKNS